MRALLPVLLLLTGGVACAGGAPPPEVVAVLYNSAVPESRELAEFYRDARKIPAANLVGLDMPAAADVSREDYEKKIAGPLRAEFDRRGWWQRAKDSNGVVLPARNRIRVLVTMRGVPLRIRPTPKQPVPEGQPPPPPPKDPVADRDEAAVDSELAMVGVQGVPTKGVLQNRYYKSTARIVDTIMPFLLLTARIDAASDATCRRMIRDAVETEPYGLWGMSYVDIANKFPQGDQWLETVVAANFKTGIPTVVDRFNQTLPKNYPMTEAALYHGWYEWNVNGPFLNPRFSFRKGAVAMHLHSFSAEQLTNPNKNWCAPLLERGAAATVGNVYEPYLHLTHDFGLLHQRLLEGFSWVEACWAAMPVTSWQGVVLGDPLYQPYLHLSGTGTRRKEDRDFRAVRAAMMQWPDSPQERFNNLDKAARRLGSGLLAEAAGLEMLERKLPTAAAGAFRTARGLFITTEDKLRQDFHLIAMDRAAGRKELALRGLRDAQLRVNGLPEGEALAEWIRILDPPPPPPAAPAKK